MNKTTIEWTNYTVNPIKGVCKTGCSYCYARKIYDRFKWDPEVRLDLNAFYRGVSVAKLKKPSKIFVCSTHEIFGDWLKEDWVEWIFNIIQQHPQHIFQILTKCPENIGRFILNRTMPENVWLGVTINRAYDWRRVAALEASNAKIRFISFEPLLEDVLTTALSFLCIDWIIIGAQTQPYLPPKRGWVERLMSKADRFDIPVFLKDNLKPLMGNNLIQEFPDE